MYEQVEKPKDSTGRGGANSVAQEKSKIKPELKVKDCRQLKSLQGGWHPIQRSFYKTEGAENFSYLDPFELSNIKVEVPQIYRDNYDALDGSDRAVQVKSGAEKTYDAVNNIMTLDIAELGNRVTRIKNNKPKLEDYPKVHTAVAQAGHEMQHGYDALISKEYLTIQEKGVQRATQVLKTELRAWAIEAKIYKKYLSNGIEDEGRNLINGWDKFTSKDIQTAKVTKDLYQDNVIWARLIKYANDALVEKGPELVIALRKLEEVLLYAEMQRKEVLSYTDTQIFLIEGEIIGDDDESKLADIIKEGGLKKKIRKNKDWYKIQKGKKTIKIKRKSQVGSSDQMQDLIEDIGIENDSL